MLPSEAAAGERVAGGQRAKCRRPGEEHNSQEREKQVRRPQKEAVLRMQDCGDEEEHSLGKGPGCTPHLSQDLPRGPSSLTGQTLSTSAITGRKDPSALSFPPFVQMVQCSR